MSDRAGAVGYAARKAMADELTREAHAAARGAVAACRAPAYGGGYGLFVLHGYHTRGAHVATFGKLLFYKDLEDAVWPKEWIDCIVEVPSLYSKALGYKKGKWVCAPALSGPAAARAAHVLGPSANHMPEAKCNAALVFEMKDGELHVNVKLTDNIDAREGRVQLYVYYGAGYAQRLADAAAAAALE